MILLTKAFFCAILKTEVKKGRKTKTKIKNMDKVAVLFLNRGKQATMLKMVVLLSTVFLFFLAILAIPSQGQAVDIYRSPEVKTFSSVDNLEESSFMAFDSNFKGGGSVAICDLGGDGQNEIVVGAGIGGGPHVRVFRKDGSFISGFFVYDQSFNKGVNVACGDLNGDGRAEIITGAGYGGGPHVRVFDGQGNMQFTPGFFAFNEDFHGGINVATGDVNGDGKDEIIVGQGPGGYHVRIFNRFGQYQGIDYQPFDASFLKGGISVAAANVDGGPEDEIVMGVYKYGEPRIKVYKYNQEKTILGNFLAWDENFHGGVSLAAGDYDENGVDEIAVAVGAQGGPQVRYYRAHGEEFKASYFAYEESFRGGIDIAAGDLVGSSKPEVVTIPRRLIGDGRTDLYKYIEIDLSDQTLAWYESGVQLGKTRISSGKIGMDTPIGEYNVMSKSRRAYSSKYALYMPFWMQFTSAGHGMHELPEWPNGAKEGANHLGIKVSHGCVRMGIGPAEEVFNFADIGTPIIINN